MWANSPSPVVQTELGVTGIGAGGETLTGTISVLAEANTSGANTYSVFNAIDIDAPPDRYFAAATGFANNTGKLLEGTIETGGSYATLGTLQGPHGLVVVPGIDIIFFGDSDGDFAFNGGVNQIDYGNILSPQWGSVYALPGGFNDTDGSASGAYNPTVAVDATSATGSLLLWTAVNTLSNGTDTIDLTQNFIMEATYTITGSGSTQSASINGTETLSAGTAAAFATDIVLNPALNLFYISSDGTVSNGTVATNGAIYAGSVTYTSTNRTPLAKLTFSGASGIPSGASPLGLYLETQPSITASGTTSFPPVAARSPWTAA